jgi:hypothetical protein
VSDTTPWSFSLASAYIYIHLHTFFTLSISIYRLYPLSPIFATSLICDSKYPFSTILYLPLPSSWVHTSTYNPSPNYSSIHCRIPVIFSFSHLLLYSVSEYPHTFYLLLSIHLYYSLLHFLKYLQYLVILTPVLF